MSKSKKDKVLVFTDCYIYGGSERLMSFLMKNSLLDASFDLSLAFRNSFLYRKGMIDDYASVNKSKLNPLCLLSNETLFHQINCLSILSLFKIVLKFPFFILEKLQIYSIWNLLVFFIFLRKSSPDIIHINNGGYPAAKSCNLLVLANYLFGHAKIVYQVNNQASEATLVYKIVDAFVGKHTDVFITASHLAKNRLVDLHKFDENKIYVINNCVMPAVISQSKSEIETELKLSENSFVISHVAFLTKRKGQACLLKALFFLLEEHIDLRNKIVVVFVGNGEDEKILTELVDQYDLTKNVRFLGYRNNSQDYIAASDLFMLPSISNEDMPLVMLTALQLGKPIIASNFAGIAQAIQSEKNGVLVDLNTETFERDLSNCIYRLYMDPDLRIKLAKAAYESFEDYTPEKYGARLKKLYTNMLN